MERTRRHGNASETGMTLIEVLVTSLILVSGLLITLSVFASAGRATMTAERKSAMTAVAQRELEKIRALPYEKVGMAAVHPAGAPGPGPRAAGETRVDGGVVRPGPERFSLRGVSGSVYRYVTWRSQDCPLVNSRVSSRVATTLGIAESDVSSSVGDLCSGTQDTKRVTIVLMPDIEEELGARVPVRLSSLIADPVTLPVAGRLSVDVGSTLSPAGSGAAAPASADTAEQQLFLYDTGCSSATRQPVTASHPVRDTSINGSVCSGASQPDLMGFASIPGAPDATLFDYSNDITRSVPGGLAVVRDDRDDVCGTSFSYSSTDAKRRSRSVHTWASPPLTAAAETAQDNGRATVTLFTSTADGTQKAGRVCLTLWRRSTAQVLGRVDYALPAWPKEPTQLAVSFDVLHANLSAGERLMLTARVPSSSAADLSLFYDHPAYPSSVSVVTEKDAPLK